MKLLLLLWLFSAAVFRLSTCQLVPQMKWYVLENGTDSDQCGQTAETACKTLTALLERFNNLLNEVEDAWRQMFEKIRNPIYQEIEIQPRFPSLPIPTIPSLKPYFELCTEDRQVNYAFIDEICHQIRNIFLSHMVSDDNREDFSQSLDTYRVEKRRVFVGNFERDCNFFDLLNSYGVSLLYIRRERFMNQTQDEMISLFKLINVEILSDTNIEMTNVETNFYYNITFTVNKNVHIHIFNITSHKMRLHLNNNQMSAHIKDSVFTEGAIIISSTSTDFHQPVILENNTFEGESLETILEVRDTSNILISSCIFKDSYVLATQDFETISAILCHNSQIQMNNILFSNVSFHRMCAFENCQSAINQIQMSENHRFPIEDSLSNPDGSDRNSLLYFQNSEVTIENSRFEHNTDVYCFWTIGGNISIKNLIAIENNEMLIGRVFEAILNINNALVYNNTDFYLEFIYSQIGISVCTFKQNIYKNVDRLNGALVYFFGSNVSIIESVFEENMVYSRYILEMIDETNILIKGSNFSSNSKVFLSNALVEVIVYDSIFNYNHAVFFLNNGSVPTLIPFDPDLPLFPSGNNDPVPPLFPFPLLIAVPPLLPSDAVFPFLSFANYRKEFTNCVFNSNHGEQGGVALVTGPIKFTNCSFRNNTARNVAGVIFADSRAEVTFINCTIINNRSPNEAGAIYLSEYSTLVVENSVFANNSCSVEGGAIKAHRNSRLNIFDSVFKNNKALGADGGGIFLEDESQLEASNCQFIANTAALGGGAIMVVDHSSYSDTGSTFVNNTAADNGGAVSVHDHSVLFLTNSNFSRNKAESHFDTNNRSCLTGIAHPHDGGAIMLETYSNATITGCSFISNFARGDGGALYGRRRSQIRIIDSDFRSSKAANSGGSILVQHSMAMIMSSTFENESATMGYGGSIAAEHVGNVTIDNCGFTNCLAVYGGSVSVRAESIFNAKQSTFDGSLSTTNGGGMYISNSFVNGTNVKIKNSKSKTGAGISVHDSSKIIMTEITTESNKAMESGGTIYCMKSEINFEGRSIKFNDAQSFGGAIFAQYCQVTFDNVTFVKNTAEINGGAIHSERSTIDIHNCAAKYNSAGKNGQFAVINSKSKFMTNYLTLLDIKSNLISISNNSEAELRHVHLTDGNGYCPITVKMQSQIHLISIYSQDNITGESRTDSSKTRNDVCVDNSSSVEGTPTGMYPDSCVTKCRCYSNRHQRVLVADCSYSGLINIPESLPEHTDWLLLSGNNFTSLNIQNIENNILLQYLSKLDLHYGKIGSISSTFLDTFTENNNLLHLDLSYNELITLPQNVQNLSSLQILKIIGNKLKCSCDNIWMRDWLLNDTDLIEDYENVLCQMKSGKWIPIVKMDKAELGCIPSESFSTWKIAAMSAAGVLIAIMVAIIAKKWELIKFWLFLKFGIKFKDKADMVENIASLDYDAFINYNVNDHQWVRNEIIRLLEDNCYKVCLHTRDFVPTATIQRNISFSIKHSRKMISVVTRNYLGSNWCKEEFSQGHLEAVEGRHRFIVLIMLEDIDIDDLPDEIQKYVKTYTYIDGTKLNNDKELELFKKKLLYVMPKRPIRDFNIERNEAEYNYNVPPLFNRMFKYRDYMTRFDRP